MIAETLNSHDTNVTSCLQGAYPRCLCGNRGIPSIGGALPHPLVDGAVYVPGNPMGKVTVGNS